MSEDDDKVGYGKPPKGSQFKPGTSGNPKGRRRKEQYIPIPRQLRRDIISIDSLPTETKMPGSDKPMTISQVIMYRIARDAANGKTTAQRMWYAMHSKALQDRMEREPQVALLDAVHQMCTDPTTERDPGLESLLDNLIKRQKGLY